ncbi:MAG: pirin family protein, partial [Sphingobacteriales bacterium]
REGEHPLHGMQTWVALPEAIEESAPSFKNYTPEELPVFTDTGVWMRLIAGDAFGLMNKVKTDSPLFYLHVVLEAGARFGLPGQYSERAVYVAKGSVEVGGREYTPGKMIVFTKGVDPVIHAREPAVLMLMGGEPLGERYIWWNFVSSSKDRIEQAKSDWKEGRFILPPTDNKEFVPLPDENSKPAGSHTPPPQALS